MVLNELTLLPFAIAALLGKPMVVLELTPLLPIPIDPFRRLCLWLMRRFKVAMVAQAYPDMADELAEYIPSRRGYYLPNEAWLMRHFDLERPDGVDEDELRAVRHETLNLFYQRIALIHMLARLDQHPETLDVWGVDGNVLAFFAHVHGRYRFRPRFIPTGGALINLMMALAIAAGTCLRIVRWVRLAPSAPEHKPLGADWVKGAGQPRHNGIVRELIDGDDDIVWVFRNRALAREGRADCDARHWCVIGDGQMSLGQAVSSALWAVARIARLWRRFRRLDCATGWRLFMLPARQLEWRALFNLYRFGHFWGRDDYNVQHMLRTWECRRVGTVSLGISHGIMSANIIEPMVRFTDFDIFYVFGMDIYNRYNSATWSPRMRVHPIGAWGMDRDQLARLADPRPADILVFATPHIDRPDYLAALFEIARAFPDRKLLLRFKPGWENSVHYPRYAEMLRQAPENFVVAEQDTYEVFLHASYAVGTLSTTTAEAIHYGLASFYLDMDEVTQFVHYRDYPAMRTTSAADVIARIRGIEDGSWIYPREEMAELIDLSGLVPFDIIRKDMGLAPKQPSWRMLPDGWPSGKPPMAKVKTS